MTHSVAPAKNPWREAIKLTLPVALGYYPAGMAFGVLMGVEGFPAWLVVFTSIVVYSGAAQYAAIPLLASGASIYTLWLNTVIINLRHIFYAVVLLGQLPQKRLTRLYCLHGLTDESFSLLTTLSESTRERLFSRIIFLNHFYWVSAGAIGIVAADYLSRMIPNLDFALSCLFVILVIEQYRAKQCLWPLLLAAAAFMLAHNITQDYLLLLAVLICVVLIMVNALTPNTRNINDHNRLWLLFLSLIAIGFFAYGWLHPWPQTTNATQLAQGRLPLPWMVTAILIMGISTFALRAAPLMIPRLWLKSALLGALNFALPPAVMMILVFGSLSLAPQSLDRLVAEIIALLSVALVYRFRANVFLGMLIGVTVLNLLLNF